MYAFFQACKQDIYSISGLFLMRRALIYISLNGQMV